MLYNADEKRETTQNAANLINIMTAIFILHEYVTQVLAPKSLLRCGISN
jgi:hypothetical protein